MKYIIAKLQYITYVVFHFCADRDTQTDTLTDAAKTIPSSQSIAVAQMSRTKMSLLTD